MNAKSSKNKYLNKSQYNQGMNDAREGIDPKQTSRFYLAGYGRQIDIEMAATHHSSIAFSGGYHG